ncbi:MAG: hypothetical protein ACRD06_02770 [Terriglobia bacterium]
MTRKTEISIKLLLGSAAVGFIEVLKILTLRSLDISIAVSLFSFSVSLPINIGMDALLQIFQGTPNKHIGNISMVSLCISFIGFAAIFWHFSYVIGIMFTIATAFVVLICGYIVGKA